MCDSKFHNEILYLPIKFRLYPTKDQEILFNKTVGCCRLIYNRALGHILKEYKKQKESDSFKGNKLNISDLITRLPKIKHKNKYEFLAEVDSTAIRQSLLDLRTAFKNFFQTNKKGKRSGFPKFKQKHRSRQSFRCMMSNVVDVDSHSIKIGKLGWISARGSFELYVGQKIQNITVFKDSDSKWYCSVLVKQSQLIENHKFRSSACGIDLGVAKPITIVNADNERHKFIGQKFSKDLAVKEKRLKKYQRSYSRCLKGSKNQQKAKIKMGKAHYRVKQFRKDWTEKQSTKIASSYALVAVEDLRLKNMTKSAKGTLDNPGKNVSQKRGMNKSLIRLGLGTLLLRIEQKCLKFGSVFIRVNPRYTSLVCSSCGHRDKKSRESQSRFKCTSCNHELNADVNAAFNILDKALNFA